MKVGKHGKVYQQMDATIQSEKYIKLTHHVQVFMFYRMHITKDYYNSSAFAFKNSSASILSDDKLALLRLQTFPASESTRSESADVAGIARYLRAASESD